MKHGLHFSREPLLGHIFEHFQNERLYHQHFREYSLPTHTRKSFPCGCLPARKVPKAPCQDQKFPALSTAAMRCFQTKHSSGDALREPPQGCWPAPVANPPQYAFYLQIIIDRIAFPAHAGCKISGLLWNLNGTFTGIKAGKGSRMDYVLDTFHRGIAKVMNTALEGW